MANAKNPPGLNDLQKTAVDNLAASFKGTDAERTDCLRNVARSFVAAREFFYTKDGDPDWAGRTYAYRTWVREVMAQAHVPADVLTSTQAAIRYHVGNALRERLSDEELEDLGLRKASPRERSVEKRERTSEALALVSGGQAIDTADEIAAASRALVGVLRRIQRGDMPSSARKAAAAALAEVADVAGERVEAMK